MHVEEFGWPGGKWKNFDVNLERKKVKMGKRRVEVERIRDAVTRGAQKGEGRHEDVAAKGQATDTYKDYVRDWNFLQDTVEEKGTAKYTQEVFLDAMKEMVGEYHQSRFEKYRAAVVFRQEQDLGPGQWTQSPAFKRQFAGLISIATIAYMKKKSQALRDTKRKALEDDDDVDDDARGAITKEKAEVVVKHFLAQKRAMYARGVVMAYGGLLRHGEVINACHNHVYKENGKWYLKITGGKWRKKDETDHVWIEGADETMGMIHQPGKFTKIFPDWDEKEAVKGVQVCAKKLGWDLARKWDFHCIRHGKAVDNRLAGMPLDERMRRGRWKSRKIEERYSRHR